MDSSTFGAGDYGPPGHRCRNEGCEYHATLICAVDESEDPAVVRVGVSFGVKCYQRKGKPKNQTGTKLGVEVKQKLRLSPEPEPERTSQNRRDTLAKAEGLTDQFHRYPRDAKR